MVPVRRTENLEVFVQFKEVPQIMVRLEQSVVHQTVILNVMGSSPISYLRKFFEIHK